MHKTDCEINNWVARWNGWKYDGVLTSIKFHIDLLFHYICLMCDRL